MQVKLLIMSNISKHSNLWKAVMGSHYTCDTFLLNIIALGNEVPEYERDNKTCKNTTVHTP